jgi:hypothetical protein
MADVKIVGIDKEGVTEPRNDGSKGGALYKVPFILSGSASPRWADAFVQAWNKPEAFSTLHRPGIATVVGNRIILDGTTLEETKTAHLAVLQAAVTRANESERKQRSHEQQDADSKRQGSADFRKHVDEMVDEIKFD